MGKKKEIKIKLTSSKEKSLDKKREETRQRVKRFREKMTAEQLEEKRRKDRERYRRRKEEGVIKSIAECTRKEKKIKRRNWKKNSKAYRERIQAKEQEERFLLAGTPPESDLEENDLGDQPQHAVADITSSKKTARTKEAKKGQSKSLQKTKKGRSNNNGTLKKTREIQKKNVQVQEEYRGEK